MEQFFSKFEIMQWNGIITKKKKRKEKLRFFKLTSVKSIKTACVCTVFFFNYLKDVKKTIVLSFMFLFNLSKSAILCVKKM